MTEYIFSDNAKGSLVSAIGATDNSLTLESGEGAEFPTPDTNQAFYIYVSQGSIEEWILCESRSGDILSNLTRGQCGTSGQAFTAGASVELRLNATILGALLQKGMERTVLTDPEGGSLTAEYDGEEVKYGSDWYKHYDGTTWKKMTGQ